MKNNECNHNVCVRNVGNAVVTYCTKCGEILDKKRMDTAEDEEARRTREIRWNESLLGDNGGDILHD